MRKKIIDNEHPAETARIPGELNITAIATAMISSETVEHPVENAFDTRRGPGGSRWVAAQSGEQTLILAFDDPQTIRRITLEIEEHEVSRNQALQVAVSQDGGNRYRELIRQEYNFSPPGTTFEREDWPVTAERVTHLRLRIEPDKEHKPARATLTSLVLR